MIIFPINYRFDILKKIIRHVTKNLKSNTAYAVTGCHGDC